MDKKLGERWDINLNVKIVKKIFLTILTLGMLALAVFIYTEFYGTPWEYVKAKNAISEYIEENYQDVLVVDTIHYNWKLNYFSAKVMEKEDPRQSAYIEYVKGNIYDGYYDNTRFQLADELNHMMVSLITTTTTIKKDAIQSSYADIDVPMYKYKLKDNYSGEEPISFELTFKNFYEEKEPFYRDAYEIAKTLYNSNLNLERVTIIAFTPDGNTTLHVEILDEEVEKSMEYFLEKIEISLGKF